MCVITVAYPSTLGREDGVGWLSERGCEYPQTLVLKVHHQDDHRFIQRLDIRCHESKIPANIEISLGDRCHQLDDPESIEACESVERLGCIILDSNKRTGYRSRELKSTLIQKQADFIKLDLMECYKNVHNAGECILCCVSFEIDKIMLY